MTDFIFARIEESPEKEALGWQDSTLSYGWLAERVGSWRDRIVAAGVTPGSVVVLETDFAPDAVALFLALMRHRSIIVPLTGHAEGFKKEFEGIAQAEWRVSLSAEGRVEISRTGREADHELFQRLRELASPGLVLFSSGSTGKSKAAVHDLSRLLEKFRARKQTLRTVTFLLFDHIGGVNTMFYTLSNGGCLIMVPDRSPDAVFRVIERFQAELLPASPTFLNLAIFSEAYRRYDTRSLKVITYGTEPMPQTTLARLVPIFPNALLQQTYGLSELGILRSKSRDSGSLWVKIGGEGYETKVADGILWIRAESAMLGYLNAPSPFDRDGWFNTEDAVEVDGEYFKILGRTSEIINIGGEKVYPVEVESVIQTMEGVKDVTVRGEANPITGRIVVAEVQLTTGETAQDFKRRLHVYCRDRLSRFKIPQKIILVHAPQHGERFKKMRRGRNGPA
jgi:long-chain acyl-CoA synthetase